MLSEKELDDTQVYMQEQEQQDQQEKDNSFSEAESGSSNVGSAKYESQVSVPVQRHFQMQRTVLKES